MTKKMLASHLVVCDPLQLVKITWIDSGVKHGWIEYTESLIVAECITVGFVVYCDKDYVVIAGSVFEQEQTASEPMTIPKVLIKDLELLKHQTSE